MVKGFINIQDNFREVLGLISIEEIIKNRELSIRAELLDTLFFKSIA